jgi:hypothetical protein
MNALRALAPPCMLEISDHLPAASASSGRCWAGAQCARIMAQEAPFFPFFVPSVQPSHHSQPVGDVELEVDRLELSMDGDRGVSHAERRQEQVHSIGHCWTCRAVWDKVSPMAARTLSCGARVKSNRGNCTRYVPGMPSSWTALQSTAADMIAANLERSAQVRHSAAVTPGFKENSTDAHSVLAMGKNGAFPVGTVQLRVAL